MIPLKGKLANSVYVLANAKLSLTLPSYSTLGVRYTATQLKSCDLLQKLACWCQQQIVKFHWVTVKRRVKNPFLPQVLLTFKNACCRGRGAEGHDGEGDGGEDEALHGFSVGNLWCCAPTHWPYLCCRNALRGVKFDEVIGAIIGDMKGRCLTLILQKWNGEPAHMTSAIVTFL